MVENVTTVEKLWQRLNRFWSIFDYDVLRILLRLVKCKKADEIFDEFLSRVDISVIKDMDLVARYEIFESKGLKPVLRIKVKIDNFTDSIKKEVEEVVSKKFRLENYSLRFKGIKEGCIELVYEISNAMMSYFLCYKFDGYDLADLAAPNIISLHINDMELKIPPKIDMVRGYTILCVAMGLNILCPGGSNDFRDFVFMKGNPMIKFSLQFTKLVKKFSPSKISSVVAM